LSCNDDYLVFPHFACRELAELAAFSIEQRYFLLHIEFPLDGESTDDAYKKTDVPLGKICFRDGMSEKRMESWW